VAWATVVIMIALTVAYFWSPTPAAS
jgi:hypothetical protein